MYFGFALDASGIDLRDIDLLDIDLDLLDTDIYPQQISKTSYIPRYLQDVLKTSSRHVFKASSA